MNHLPHLHGFSVKNNEWFVEDVSLSSIAQQFGTPCYVYSHHALTKAFMAYEKACLRPDGSRRARVHFAMKSNSNLAILDVFAKLGAGFDLVSGGELERVIAAGANPHLCVFSGVGKSIAEITRALEVGVKCFNVESIPELDRINLVAQQLNCIAPISLRVNPDVDAKTHPYISTGLKDNKFGVAYESVLSTYETAMKMSHCKIIGIDCHIGSQILDIQPFLDALDRILLLISELAKRQINIQHLDLGGGLGIDYEGESTPDITEFANTLLDHIDHKGFGDLDIIFEPGRSLVGNAGVLMTEVEYLKPTPSKNFCIVNAAMNDLMRPAMYEAYHAIIPVKNKSLPSQIYDVVGPVCESGDWLGKNRELAIEPGDLLLILSAGAYGSAMSSHYNTRPKIPEVMVKGHQTYLIRERETPQQLFALERRLPDRLD
jgi:diaminopimelate decarboxylase